MAALKKLPTGVTPLASKAGDSECGTVNLDWSKVLRPNALVTDADCQSGGSDSRYKG